VLLPGGGRGGVAVAVAIAAAAVRLAPPERAAASWAGDDAGRAARLAVELGLMVIVVLLFVVHRSIGG
jgi:hypothetical protein